MNQETVLRLINQQRNLLEDITLTPSKINLVRQNTYVDLQKCVEDIKNNSTPEQINNLINSAQKIEDLDALIEIKNGVVYKTYEKLVNSNKSVTPTYLEYYNDYYKDL